MHGLQKQFHNFIDSHHLVKENEKVLVAVSGGLDSMVLAELLRCEEFDLAIAHCNFGLRGQESDDDARLVEDYATEYAIPFFIKKINLDGNSIQLEAREKRYAWFGKLVEEHGFAKVATAHHLNDSLETTLFNLTRGTGIKGLAGMQESNGDIIRPLLPFSKEELKSYALAKKLSWREDSSNDKTDYDRNKIRHEAIPALKKVNASLEHTFRNTKERFDLLASMVQGRVTEVLSEHFDAEEGKLDLRWMVDDHDLLILSEILSGYGFNYVTSKEVWAARDQPGKTFEAGAWKVVMDRESLFIQQVADISAEEMLISEMGSFDVAGATLELKRVTISDGQQIKDLLTADESSALLDGSKLAFPLKIRKWHAGDIFIPLGMTGTKKVSDLLIDQKVPLVKKEKVLVLESNSEIVWVIGHRISDRYKVQKDTVEAVQIRFI